MRSWIGIAIAATTVALIARAPGGEAIGAEASPRAGASIGPIPTASDEHRYRIGARLRLGLFSVSRDDIGSAVMTWRSTNGAKAIALLAGSDPNRVPAKLNRWAYVREEVRDESAAVFSLRNDDTVPYEHARAADDQTFNAGCTTLTTHDVHTSVTTVAAPGTTYRSFDRLLEQLEITPAKWRGQHIVRPPGAEAGFLTAMHRLLSAADIDARGRRSVSYVFNNNLYDLKIKRARPLGPTTVGSRRFEQLTRIDLTIRNRTSGDVTGFAVTTTPEVAGAALPVQIIFQPSFWIVVELGLDDRADVPRDPADDGSLLTRMRGICASVTR